MPTANQVLSATNVSASGDITTAWVSTGITNAVLNGYSNYATEPVRIGTIDGSGVILGSQNTDALQIIPRTTVTTGLTNMLSTLLITRFFGGGIDVNNNIKMFYYPTGGANSSIISAITTAPQTTTTTSPGPSGLAKGVVTAQGGNAYLFNIGGAGGTLRYDYLGTSYTANFADLNYFPNDFDMNSDTNTLAVLWTSILGTERQIILYTYALSGTSINLTKRGTLSITNIAAVPENLILDGFNSNRVYWIPNDADLYTATLPTTGTITNYTIIATGIVDTGFQFPLMSYQKIGTDYYIAMAGQNTAAKIKTNDQSITKYSDDPIITTNVFVGINSGGNLYLYGQTGGGNYYYSVLSAAATPSINAIAPLKISSLLNGSGGFLGSGLLYYNSSPAAVSSITPGAANSVLSIDATGNPAWVRGFGSVGTFKNGGTQTVNNSDVPLGFGAFIGTLSQNASASAIGDVVVNTFITGTPGTYLTSPSIRNVEFKATIPFTTTATANIQYAVYICARQSVSTAAPTNCADNTTDNQNSYRIAEVVSINSAIAPTVFNISADLVMRPGWQYFLMAYQNANGSVGSAAATNLTVQITEK